MNMSNRGSEVTVNLDHGLLFSELLLINIVLSGDNAVIIAMASKSLPARQRKAAIWWGTAGAIVLRIALAVAAVFVLNVPFIQAVGSLLLLYIAIKLITEQPQQTEVRSASTLWSAVWTIMVADLVMSLDNVLAVAAVAKHNIPVLAAGIIMSIPIILWGSAMIVKLLERFAAVLYVGSAVLGYTAGEMLVSDRTLTQWFRHAHPSYEYVVPIVFVVIVVSAGWLWRKSQP